MEIRVKRVYEPIAEADGERALGVGSFWLPLAAGAILSLVLIVR